MHLITYQRAQCAHTESVGDEKERKQRCLSWRSEHRRGHIQWDFEPKKGSNIKKKLKPFKISNFRLNIASFVYEHAVCRIHECVWLLYCIVAAVVVGVIIFDIFVVVVVVAITSLSFPSYRVSLCRARLMPPKFERVFIRLNSAVTVAKSEAIKYLNATT